MSQPFYAIFFLLANYFFTFPSLPSLITSTNFLFKSLLHTFTYSFVVHLSFSTCSYYSLAFWFCIVLFFYHVSGIYHIQTYLSKCTVHKRNTSSFCCPWSEEHALRDIYTFPYNVNYNFIRFFLGSTQLSFPL